MGMLRRLFGDERGRKEALRKEALVRNASPEELRAASRLLAEGIVRSTCEAIEATRGIPADEVWAELTAHLDMDELGAIYVAKIPEELGQRAKAGDPDAQREWAQIARTELIAALERHGGDTSLLPNTP
jgi:hypothetical protein